MAEGIEVEVYRFSDPLTKENTLNGREDPTYLGELKGLGGGSIKISKSDPKIVKDPTLIASRNILKQRVNGAVVGAWLIATRKATTIAAGESAGEAYEIAGEGLKTWFNDAVVLPYGGLQPTSLDTRAFNFASERGEWYNSGVWVNPYVMGQVHTLPVWGDYPTKWPEGNAANWIWAQSFSSSAPAGTCYFRYEFTSIVAATYSIYAAGDDTLSIWADGQQLSVTGAGTSGFTEATNVKVSLPAGDHVLAFQVSNGPGTTGYNPGGLAMALYTVQGDVETFVAQSGGGSWKALAYPAQAPGWSAGEVIMTLLAEAEARGVAFASIITPTFTTLVDSNGDPWGDPLPWEFNVGDPLSTVLAKMEELVCDAWIDPDTYEFHMVAQRGVDRSDYIYDVDGISVISTPVIFQKGVNLRAASSESRGKIVNSLAIKTSAGWLTTPEVDEESAGIYGVIEGKLDTGTSSEISKTLAGVIFIQKAKEEEGASYDIYPRPEDPVPFIHYGEGDWVLAPDDTGLLVKRKIMSLSLNESDSGQPLYSIEFDTIFQDNDARVNSAISKLGGGGAGGSYSNAGGGNGTIGNPVVVTSPNPPIKIPKSPTGLAATSAGQWSPNGVTPYAEVTVTWDPVTENTDGSEMIPTFYEIWGHLTSAGDGAYAMYAQVTSPTATMRPFEPLSEWTFKVLARSQQRASSFSAEITHTMVGPTTPMDAPDAPTLSSNKGVLVVNWDGLLDSASPPPQFRYVYAMVATTAGGTYVRMGGAFQRETRYIYISGLTIGNDYWVRLIAVDGAGIASAASSATPTNITGIDLGDLDESIEEAIDAAHQAGLEARGMSNMLNDPSFEANDPTMWSLETSDVTNVTTTPFAGDRSLRINASTANFIASQYGMVIEVAPGETYQIAGWARTVGTGGSAEFAIILGLTYGVDELTLTSEVDIIASPILDSDYEYFSGTWEVPDGVHFVKPFIKMTDDGNTNAYLIDALTFRMMIPGALIINGAITTDKIGAGEITGTKIAADTISALNIQAGAVVAGKIAAGAVTAETIAASAVTADSIAAGAITVLQLSAEVGQQLDISSNDSVNIIVGQINSVTDDQNDTASSLETMQTYYQFGADGAVISSPSSPFAVHIANDKIEMLQLGVQVSYWTAGQMFVNSLVGTEVILGNHKLEKYGNGTVVRAL